LARTNTELEQRCGTGANVTRDLPVCPPTFAQLVEDHVGVDRGPMVEILNQPLAAGHRDGRHDPKAPDAGTGAW
jgi:hypothetical protein